MKTTLKLFVVLLIFSFSTSISAQENEKVETAIIGDWENKDFGVEYSFRKGQKVYFSQGGFGQTMDYILDTTKSPIWLDIEMKMNGNSIVIPTLLKIVDDNTIWIEQFPPTSNHPTEFSENAVTTSSIHVLTRKQ